MVSCGSTPADEDGQSGKKKCSSEDSPAPDCDRECADSETVVVEANVEKLRTAVQHLRSKYREEKCRSSEYREHLQRLNAEFDNFRKRTMRSQKKQEKRVKTEVVKTILPSVDNLRRVLTATEDEDDPIRKGVEMILRQFEDRLANMGIVRIQARGEKFDPTWHEAVAQVETPQYPEGTVVEEVLPGYRMDDILVRAAKVKVARGRQSNSDNSQTADGTTNAAREDR